MVIQKTVEKVWIFRIFIVFLVCEIYVWALSVTGWINSNDGSNLMMTFIGWQNIFRLQILLYFNFASMTLTLKWNSWLYRKHPVNLTVCSYHVTYVFQSESTLYSCLIVKELLARSRHEIWRWSDCNWTRTQNHLVLKWTLNHLAKLTKWLSCVLSTYLSGAIDCMFLSCHVCVSEWIHTP